MRQVGYYHFVRSDHSRSIPNRELNPHIRELQFPDMWVSDICKTLQEFKAWTSANAADSTVLLHDEERSRRGAGWLR